MNICVDITRRWKRVQQDDGHISSKKAGDSK